MMRSTFGQTVQVGLTQRRTAGSKTPAVRGYGYATLVLGSMPRTTAVNDQELGTGRSRNNQDL